MDVLGSDRLMPGAFSVGIGLSLVVRAGELTCVGVRGKLR